MSDTGLAILLGLLAALLLSLAAFIEQRAAREEVRFHRSPLRTAASLMARLVRNRVWLTGWGVNLAGFGTHASALHFGTVALVQPLMSAQMVFALPMASLERRTWPRLRDWVSILAIAAGLTIFLLVEGAAPLEGHPDRPEVVLASFSVIVVVGCLLAIARRLDRRAASVIISAGAGLCFAMTAVFMKLTADGLVNNGVGHTARDWVGYALAGSTFLGLVLEQAAFAGGPLPWAIATMSSVNVLASYCVGVLAFDVAVATDPGSLAAIATVGALLVAGAVGLAHSPSASVWSPETATPQ